MKRIRKIVCCMIIVFVLIFFRGWFVDCFSSEAVLGAWEDTVKKEIEIGKKYSQEFICRGELKKLTFYLSGCENNSGSMKVYVTDHTGRYIRGCGVQNILFSDYSTPEIMFTFTFQEKLKLGHVYTMIWECGNIGKESRPVFKAVQGSSRFYELKINGEPADYRIYAEYDYKKAVSMKKLLVFIVVVSMLFGLIFFDINLKVKNGFLMDEGIAVFTSVIGYIVIELASGNIKDVSVQGFLINIVPIYIAVNVIWIICRSVKFSASVILILTFLIGTANHYILLFKGNPILPWELYAVKTAASVAGNYEYEGSVDICISFVIVFTALKLILSLHKAGQNGQSERRRVLLVKVSAGCVIYSLVVLPGIQVELWGMSEKYSEQGFIASFLGYARYARQMSYDEPLGYSKEYCRDLIDTIDIVKTDEKQTAENIIVIMNESFSDFRVYGDRKGYNGQMPFLDSLRENTVYGNLYVPVFGGVTANTEFEFLTGISCSFVGSIPYEMHIKNNMNSLAVLLKNKKFHAFAFHPYDASNWNRDDVYPKLGFQRFDSIEDMEHPEYLRWCVSDASDYRYVIEDYEKNKGKKYFMFNVTMQNHGGYGGENNDLELTSDLSEFGEYPLAETYLSCIKQSDKAIQELISYFQNVDEPTVICFFGDHQPVIEDAFYEQLLGKRLGELTVEENLKRYITPFYIWANYDIHEQYINKISVNYLMTILLKTAGYDLEGYESFLYQLYLNYPVITMAGILDSKGNVYASTEEINDRKLTDYKMLQYDRMKGH